jgi:hypothetical protein
MKPFPCTAANGGCRLNSAMACHLLIGSQPNLVMKIAKISQIKARARRKTLTFGDFVAEVYQTWGERRAKGIVKLALAVQLIQFHDAYLG